MAHTSPAVAICKGIMILVFLPVALAIPLLMMLLWAVMTLTGIGPLLHHFATKRDAALLASCLDPAKNAIVRRFTLPGTTRSLAVRWNPGTDPGLPPVAIPNGLGATLITIGALHDALQSRGYPVLSYDRAGVGLSDSLPPEQAHHSSAAHLVQDMKSVLDAHEPVGGSRPWILIGPSMGSIAAQAYMAEHPADVAGFVNVDGLPFPFAVKRAKFIKSGGVYSAVASIVWTGAMRAMLSLASGELAKLATPTFPLPIVRAQMNERNFFASLAREMVTMMDLCDAVRAAWGPGFDISSMPPDTLNVLVNAEPSACGNVTPSGKWEDQPRATVELGPAWGSRAEAQALVQRLLVSAVPPSMAAPPLLGLFPRMPVRAMSARCYDFGPASGFYDNEMKAYAAAEHNLHVLLARDGKRTVFPWRTHSDMFFTLVPFIATQADEIAAALGAGKAIGPDQV